MFAKADVVLLTKTDLLPHLNIDVSAIYHALARVMPDPVVIPLMAQQPGGINGWMDWLKQRHAAPELIAS